MSASQPWFEKSREPCAEPGAAVQLRLRAARRGDVSALRALVGKHAAHAPPWATNAEPLPLVDVEGRRSCLWVLEQETGGLLGVAGGHALNHIADAWVFEIRYFYLHPAVRPGGWTKKMLYTCLAEAVRLGYQYGYLEVTPPLRDLPPLLMEVGFWRVAERMRYDTATEVEAAYLIRL